jgi:hypothetical protein
MRTCGLGWIGTALLFACSQGSGGGSGSGDALPDAGIDGGGSDVGRTDAGVDAGSPAAGGSDGGPVDGGRSDDGGPVDAGSATHALLLHVSGGQGTISAAGMPDCRDSCTALVPTGSSVSLTAAADSGWSFSGWSGDCTGSGSCELLVDRDREVTATFAPVPPPPPPDECAGLVPPSVPPPNVFTVPPDSYANECAPGTTDGSGTMVLPTLPTGGAPPGTFIFRFVGLDGLLKGSFTDRFDDIYIFDILEQANGFVVARYDNFVPSNKADSVFTVSPTGVKGPPQYPGSSFMIDAVNPVGGAVTALQDPPNSGPYEIVSWDEALNRRWTVNTGAEEVLSVGVDRNGATLVVVREKADSSNLSAFWIDPSGVAGAEFVFGSEATRLVPRVGDGFFVYDYVPTLVTPVEELPAQWPEMGTPLAQIDSYAADVKAPPAWLAARPHKGLHTVHGGAGYALIDPAGDVASCGQQIEVLAPSGKSCGTASFFIADGACRAGRLTVGYDGTVIQQLPVAMEPVSEIAPGFSEHACTWRYWPGFFR